jgi:hypothetical protein
VTFWQTDSSVLDLRSAGNVFMSLSPSTISSERSTFPLGQLAYSSWGYARKGGEANRTAELPG